MNIVFKSHKYQHLSKHPLIAFLSAKAKQGSLFGFILFLALLCLTTDAEAALFSQLTQSGSTIFEGMKDIIYAVAGFGIVGVAIGAFFGNLNWKWLSAIIIGLMVIAGTAGILMYMTETEDLSSLSITITDSLKNAAPLPPKSK